MTEITQILIPIITLILGALIGHRLQLGRERRKEYNELADQLFAKVNRTIHKYSDFGIGKDEADLLYRRMGRVHRWRLQKAIEKFHAASTWKNIHGQIVLDNPEAADEALKKVAKLLRRK